MSDETVPVTLAIETSSIACSAALLTRDGLRQRYREEANVHSKQLLRMIDEVLAEAQLALADVELLGVGVGPGSFTGLRIGVGVAQGLAYAHKLPVCGVSSLHALALPLTERAKPGDLLLCGLDARMSEVYWGVFECLAPGIVKPLGDLSVSAPQDVSLPRDTDVPVWLAGNAWSVYDGLLSAGVQACLRSQSSVSCHPQAVSVAEQARLTFEAGDAMDWRTVQPLYVRNDIARKSTKPAPLQRCNEQSR